MAWASCGWVKGLPITLSMPAAMQAWRSSSLTVAVRARMGRRGRPRVRSWRRISAAALRPSITGMRQSISTSSGRSVSRSARLTACLPSVTRSLRTPRPSRNARTISAFTSSSSATSTSRGRRDVSADALPVAVAAPAGPPAPPAAPATPAPGRDASGRQAVKLKREPRPGVLCTAMSPPMAMAISRAMVRPRPTPSVGRSTPAW